MLFEWDEHVAHYFAKYLSLISKRFDNNISLLSFVFFRVRKLCYLQLEAIISEFSKLYKIRNKLNNTEIFPKVITCYKNEFSLKYFFQSDQGQSQIFKSSHQMVTPKQNLCSKHMLFLEIWMCSKNFFDLPRNFYVF